MDLPGPFHHVTGGNDRGLHPVSYTHLEWGARGVRLNAVAPGNVHTAMTDQLSPQQKVAVQALPVPMNYGTDALMDPVDLANAIVFLAFPEAHGINGVVLFVDAGTDALLNSEKVY